MHVLFNTRTKHTSLFRHKTSNWWVTSWDSTAPMAPFGREYGTVFVFIQFVFPHGVISLLLCYLKPHSMAGILEKKNRDKSVKSHPHDSDHKLPTASVSPPAELPVRVLKEEELKFRTTLPKHSTTHTIIIQALSANSTFQNILQLCHVQEEKRESESGSWELPRSAVTPETDGDKCHYRFM